jgi:hypothetical protein
MKNERYLVTVINRDDSVFTYGVTTIGGRASAVEKVKSRKKSNIDYFVHARLSDEKADYEIIEEKLNIPLWVTTIK